MRGEYLQAVHMDCYVPWRHPWETAIYWKIYTMMLKTDCLTVDNYPVRLLLSLSTTIEQNFLKQDSMSKVARR